MLFKYYYKVVDQDLRSVINFRSKIDGGSEIPDMLNIQYEIGEWVYPKLNKSKLFVFNSLMNAGRFVETQPLKIFKCEIKNPQIVKKVCYWSRCSPIILSCQNNMEMTYKVFENTILCDAVKLVEEITYKEIYLGGARI